MQELIKYCQTDRQRQVIEAMVEHGSERKAAAALGCGKSAVHEVVRRVNEYFSPKEVPATEKSKYRKHFVIPDVQAKPGVPLDSAITEEDVLALCHFTNLRPVWASENLGKGAKREFLI